MTHSLVWRVALATAATAAAVGLGGCSADDELSSRRSSTSATSGAQPTGVYDAAALHSIALDLDDKAYASMIETYLESDEKEWLQVDVTIDGTTFRDAGLRLKGNSSLRGVSADSNPTDLPWLVRLDKFVDGQALDGWTEFVVRSSSTSTAINEAVALDLLAEAGLASEHAIAAAFSVNGSKAKLRLVVQHLDEAWEEENFDTAGQLYKAEAGGDWSYRGTDPDNYVDVFDQETGSDDMTPLISFLDFVNNSSDADFEAQLPDRLDVESFATYLAFQDLIGNFDDIDGPGNNSYLRWEAEAKQFTVVAWDHNLAFGASPGGVGGRAPRGAEGWPPQPPEGMELPEGAEPPAEMAPPEGMELPEGVEPPEGSGDGAPPRTGRARDRSQPGGRPGGGPGGRSNVLVERFTEVETFQTLVDEASARMRADLYDSGRAEEVVDTWVTLLTAQAADLVDADTVTTEADRVRAVISGGSPGGRA